MKFLACMIVALVVGGIAHAEAVSAEAQYQKACQLRDSGQLAEAIECVGQGIALNPVDKDVFAKCELLSAELYLALEMYEAADVAARQVQMLYPDSPSAERATALRETIQQIRQQAVQKTETKQ